MCGALTHVGNFGDKEAIAYWRLFQWPSTATTTCVYGTVGSFFVSLSFAVRIRSCSCVTPLSQGKRVCFGMLIEARQRVRYQGGNICREARSKRKRLMWKPIYKSRIVLVFIKWSICINAAALWSQLVLHPTLTL